MSKNTTTYTKDELIAVINEILLPTVSDSEKNVTLEDLVEIIRHKRKPALVKQKRSRM